MVWVHQKKVVIPVFGLRFNALPENELVIPTANDMDTKVEAHWLVHIYRK